MAFSLNTTLGELLNNPAAKAVLDQQFPGLSANPMVMMVKGVALNQILAMPQAAQFGLTKEKVEAALVEINKRI